MRGCKRVYIRLGAHAAGRGASGKRLHVRTGCTHGQACAPDGKGAIALSAIAWKGARTGEVGHGRMGPGEDTLRSCRCGSLFLFVRAQTHRVQTYGNGRRQVGLGADYRNGRVGSGADSSCAWSCGRKQGVRARMDGKSRAAIAVRTRIWARTGVTSVAGMNVRVLELAPAWGGRTQLPKGHT
jgi:hypothetical protein